MDITHEQLWAFSPWIFLALGMLLTLLVSVIRVDTKRPAQICAAITLFLTTYLSFKLSLGGVSEQAVFSGMFKITGTAHFALQLISLTALFFVLGSSRYLERERIHLSEFYHLILIMVLGASLMVGARDLLSVFVCLEMMSLPAYTLAGFRRYDSKSNEAGIKYFILGGAMGAVYLLGAALVFGGSGSIVMDQVYLRASEGQISNSLLCLGHLLMIGAFLFKVAAVPFHFWKPDVYEGAPLVVTGLMTTIVTSAAYMTLIQLLGMIPYGNDAFLVYSKFVKTMLIGAAMLSVLLGSLIMITQLKLKRLLAYSSIVQTGFLLIGLLSAFEEQAKFSAVWAYLIGYAVLSVGLFFSLSQSEKRGDQGLELIDLTGLMKKNRIQTLLITVFLLSSAGLPLTYGFFMKLQVLMQAVSVGQIAVVIFALVTTVIAAYAYLRPIGLMMMRDADSSAATFGNDLAPRVISIFMAALVILFGLMPGYVQNYLTLIGVVK